MWVDMLFVPPTERRRGKGRALYEQWEKDLPPDVEVVFLFAADTDGSGNSDEFWDRLGFDYRYTSDDPEHLTYEEQHWMVKGVNGHRTPEPLWRGPEEDEEEGGEDEWHEGEWSGGWET